MIKGIGMSAKHRKEEIRPGVDQYGRTPHHYAAAEGDLAQVCRLIASGVDPGAVDDDGWTPLHFAAQAYATEIAERLLDAGARIDARDSHGNTPLSTAVFSSQGHGELIRFLRAHGADPQARNNHGISPVSLARMIANFNVRQFFDDQLALSDEEHATKADKRQ